VQKARFDAGEKKLNYAELCKLLTQWRSETQTSWLKDAPTHPLQQALKDLERAYTNFLPNGPTFRVSRRRDDMLAFVFQTRSRSSSIR
jgi:putative transposase